MNKIADLLKQMGASPELQKQIMEALESYKESVQTKLEEDFKQKVAQAKKVCVEAVEAEKRELAKKIEVFLEARTTTIQKEAAKHAAIGESEAVRLLRGCKTLLEGIQIDSKEGSGQAAIAETEEVKQLRIQNKQLKESLEKAQLKAQRANAIALKSLERNKVLESKTAPVAPAKPVTESKETPKLRKTSAQPTTARPALTESVVKAPATVAESADPSIAAIASTLDGSPAYIQ